VILAPHTILCALSLKEPAHRVRHRIDVAGGINPAVGPGSAVTARRNTIVGSGGGGVLLDLRTTVPTGASVAPSRPSVGACHLFAWPICFGQMLLLPDDDLAFDNHCCCPVGKL